MGAVLVMTSTASSQTADAGAFKNGTASATSQAIKVNPTAASLSIGITFGVSLAGYTNDTAKAEARGIDLGIIGTTLAAEACDGGDPTLKAEDQPQPLAVDSRDAAAAPTNPTTHSRGGLELPGFLTRARAPADPSAEATSLVVPLGQAGALEISGARADTVTHIIDKKTREAVATSEIGSLIIGGGAVRLGNLKRQVVHRTGAENTKTATFTIGSATIGGSLVPLPLPTSDPSAVFAAINPVLATFGVELRPPVSHEVNGGIQLDPMSIAVVPSPTRDAIAGQVLAALDPVRQQLVAALLAQHCSNDTYITVADIALGSFTGAGSFSLELGGATAYTGELDPEFQIGDIQGPTSFAGTADELIPGTEGSAFDSSSGAVSSGAVAGNRSTKGGTRVAAPIASTFDGKRGGKLALLGGGVLLLLALVAELDRRKMLAAMKSATITEA
jgi:hypothetical protein